MNRLGRAVAEHWRRAVLEAEVRGQPRLILAALTVPAPVP